jgi:hypothetical protein
VLALALIVVFFIAAMSAGLLQLSSATTRRQTAATNRKLAFYMAEAGLAEGYLGLMVGKTGRVGSRAAPAVYGGGLFWVEATEDAQDDTVTLRSTGMVGNARAVLSAVLEKEEPMVASLGVFADTSVDLPPGSLVDGYDSRLGGYAPPAVATKSMSGSNPTRLGRLASNALVRVRGTVALPTVVDGDLVPGPSNQVALVGNVQVTGSTEPSTASTTLPEIDLPQLSLTPGVVHESGVPLVVLPGETGMEFLTVKKGSQAVFQGPATIVLGSLLLEPGGDLTLDNAAGMVNVYVSDALELHKGSTLSTTSQDPSQAMLQVPAATNAPVRLGARADFYGIVLAPESDVVVNTDFELFGALIGRDLRFVGPARLHFDRALEHLSVESGLPRLLSWRIVEVVTPRDMGNTLDPFAYLGVDGSDLAGPAAAHEDQPITVDYIDREGALRTYAGMESAFDWSEVQSVTEIHRDGELVPDLASTN